MKRQKYLEKTTTSMKVLLSNKTTQIQKKFDVNFLFSLIKVYNIF